MVDGLESFDFGSYSLNVRSASIVCGDGFRDSGEQCDDGNKKSGDGCSDTCTIESKEQDPNNTLGTGTPYVDPFHGSINPAGDVDFVAVTVAQGPATLVAKTFDYGDGACSFDELDSDSRS